MDNEAKITGNFYLLPDLDPPEMRQLLDRLNINMDDEKNIHMDETDYIKQMKFRINLKSIF